MRALPFPVRGSEDTRTDAEIEAGLVILRHPSEPLPWLIASDNKVAVARFPQPRWATLSRWQSPDGQPRQFAFVPMSIMVPEEGEDMPAELPVTIANNDPRLIELVISDARRLVTADFAIVRASAPDTVLYEQRELEVSGSQFGPAFITFSLTLAPILDYPHPGDMITEERFPALYTT